jgi:hypothetical protein
MPGDDIGTQRSTGFVGPKFDSMLLDAVEGHHHVFGDRAMLVAARIDEGSAVAEAAGLKTIEGVNQSSAG